MFPLAYPSLSQLFLEKQTQMNLVGIDIWAVDGRFFLGLLKGNLDVYGNSFPGHYEPTVWS